MKKIFYLIFLSFISNLSGFSQNTEANDSILPWNLSRLLKWSDFRGKVDPNKFGSALTSHKIEVLPANIVVDRNDNIQGYENLTVQAQFYRNSSWTVTNSQSILDHEQLHFDIAELFARKIRKEFSGFKANKIVTFSVYLDCYILLWNDSRNMQERYDSETRNGQDISKNQLWATEISKQLENLDNFK